MMPQAGPQHHYQQVGILVVDVRFQDRTIMRLPLSEFASHGEGHFFISWPMMSHPEDNMVIVCDMT